MNEQQTSKTLLLLAALMLAGCAGGISEAQVNAGRTACANYGGVKWHWVNFENTDVDVWCNDGTKITQEIDQ